MHDRTIPNPARWSAGAAKQVLHHLAVLKLGDRKLSAVQRDELFRALVRRITPQDETLRVCEIELNANIAPRLVEAPVCTWTENLSSRPKGQAPVAALLAPALPGVTAAGVRGAWRNAWSGGRSGAETEKNPRF